MMLKQSPIYLLKDSNNKRAEDERVTTARSKALDQISKFTIWDPFSTSKNANEASLDAILLDIDKLKQIK